MIKTFFDEAVNAIREEEAELNKLFAINQTLYQTQHNGVCVLYETTFVYLIFKKLLLRKFPYTIYWEYPYPDNKQQHSDIALLNGNGRLEALIEFKLWIKDDDIQIRTDVLKLQPVKDCMKYIFIVGYGGDLMKNDDFLLKNSSLIHPAGVSPVHLTTRFYKTKLGAFEDNDLNIFMYEVKDEVLEPHSTICTCT